MRWRVDRGQSWEGVVLIRGEWCGLCNRLGQVSEVGLGNGLGCKLD